MWVEDDTTDTKSRETDGPRGGLVIIGKKVKKTRLILFFFLPSAACRSRVLVLEVYIQVNVVPAFRFNTT